MVPDKWWPNVDDMLDYQIRRGEGKDGGPLKWKEFSEKLVSGCWGPDQVYYKYKTDFWKEGGGFPTPSGKFEFKSQHLESLGYDGLPVFSEPGESPVSTPELFKEYPLVMSSGYRQPFYFLGQYRNIPWLRSFMEFPTCQLHPETAKLYGVEDGDIVWIESPRGSIRQKLRTFPGIKKGVLMATANCFYPEEPAEGYHGVFISNPNVLTSNDHLDPMYGSPDLTCLLCKVYKAKDEELKEEVFRSEEYGFVPQSEGATEAKEQLEKDQVDARPSTAGWSKPPAGDAGRGLLLWLSRSERAAPGCAWRELLPPVLRSEEHVVEQDGLRGVVDLLEVERAVIETGRHRDEGGLREGELLHLVLATRPARARPLPRGPSCW